jgi:hypothetical protein
MGATTIRQLNKGGTDPLPKMCLAIDGGGQEIPVMEEHTYSKLEKKAAFWESHCKQNTGPAPFRKSRSVNPIPQIPIRKSHSATGRFIKECSANPLGIEPTNSRS